LHGVPFRLKLVGAALLPLNAPLNPNSTVPPAGICGL